VRETVELCEPAFVSFFISVRCFDDTAIPISKMGLDRAMSFSSRFEYPRQSRQLANRAPASPKSVIDRGPGSFIILYGL